MLLFILVKESCLYLFHGSPHFSANRYYLGFIDHKTILEITFLQLLQFKMHALVRIQLNDHGGEESGGASYLKEKIHELN